jgi:HEAT repeat protein
MANREVITVFLASPGDVSPERELAREVVEQVNRKVASHLNLYVELYGWEDQAPGYGRPQGQINPHVDEADLFIGMLWRHWGTPSSDRYTSGFEEEYRRACDRRKDGDDRPEVWLFFKHVDDAQRNDAGPDLERVLAFRREIEEAREALYETFTGPDDWREKLSLLVMEYITKWHLAHQRQEPERAPNGYPAGRTDTGISDEGPSDASRQLIEALEGARDVIADSDGSATPDLFQATRLLLASFGWASEMRTSETLDTHQVNLLYAYRDRLKVLPRERLQLVRSMLTQDMVRPGWYWLRESQPVLALAYLATSDPDADVRRRAVETLGDATVLSKLTDIPDLQPDVFLRQALDDEDSGVRIAAVELAGRLASDDMLELLRGLQHDPTLKGWATAALVRGLLPRQLDEALDVLANDKGVALEVADELLAIANRFSDDHLTALRESDSSWLRDIGLRIEIESGRLTEDDARSTLTDPDGGIRARALDAMQARGWTVADDAFSQFRAASGGLPLAMNHRRDVHQMMTQSEETLRQIANWYLPGGSAAYEAIGCLDWHSFGDQVRRDLHDRFETFRVESMEDLRRRFGEPGVEALGKESEFRDPDYSVVALSLLAEHGTADDSEVVRPYLAHEHSNVRAGALRALARLHPEDAIREALRTAGDDTERSTDRLAAAKIAAAISPSAALELSESLDGEVASFAIAKVPGGDEGLTRLTALLHSENSSAREAAVKRLAVLVERPKLETALRNYMDGHYYYNVVVWFDRFLYCPEPFIDLYLGAARSSS